MALIRIQKQDAPKVGAFLCIGCWIIALMVPSGASTAAMVVALVIAVGSSIWVRHKFGKHWFTTTTVVALSLIFVICILNDFVFKGGTP